MIAVISALAAAPAAAQDDDQWPIPKDTVAAVNGGENDLAKTLLGRDFARCFAEVNRADRCLTILYILTNIYRAEEKYDAAVRFAKSAVTIVEGVPQASAENRATSYNNLGLALTDDERFEEADAAYRQAIAVAEDEPELSPLLAAAIHNNYGRYLLYRQRHAEAVPILERALALFRELYPSGNDLLADTERKLAGAYYETGEQLNEAGRYGKAEEALRKALELDLRGGDGRAQAQTFNSLAISIGQQGRVDEAEALLRQALSILDRLDGPDTLDHGYVRNTLGRNLYGGRDYAAAEEEFRRAAAIFERELPDGHPDLAAVFHNLAGSLSAQGRYGQAEEYYSKALALRERALPENHWLIGLTLNDRAMNSRRVRNWAEAETQFRQARQVFARSLERDAMLRINADWGLGAVLQASGKDAALSRTLFRTAARSLSERSAKASDYGSDVLTELRGGRPIFTGQVQVAWTLAEKGADRWLLLLRMIIIDETRRGA